jgi:hypothetical protein
MDDKNAAIPPKLPEADLERAAADFLASTAGARSKPIPSRGASGPRA